jgi:hypothetical protein
VDEFVGQRRLLDRRRLGVGHEDDLVPAAAVEPEHALPERAVLDGDRTPILADQQQGLELRVVEPSERLARFPPGAVAVLGPGDEADRDGGVELQPSDDLDAGHRPGDDGLPLALVEAVLGRHRERLVVPVAVLPAQAVGRWVRRRVSGTRRLRRRLGRGHRSRLPVGTPVRVETVVAAGRPGSLTASENQ